jgi:hypothetical protein
MKCIFFSSFSALQPLVGLGFLQEVLLSFEMIWTAQEIKKN